MSANIILFYIPHLTTVNFDIIKIMIYSLYPDLFELRPYEGDFHSADSLLSGIPLKNCFG